MPRNNEMTMTLANLRHLSPALDRASLQRVSLEKTPFEDDLHLAGAALRRVPEAERTLVGRLMAPVRRTVFYLSAADPDVDDFVQLSIIEIMNSLGTFRAESALESWATKIAVRTTIRELKKKQWRMKWVGFSQDGALERADLISQDTGEEAVARRRVRLRVLLLLGKMKSKYRVALILRLMLGHSVGEIAEITDVTFNTVRERLRVGRKQLHKLIERDPVLGEWIQIGGEIR